MPGERREEIEQWMAKYDSMTDTDIRAAMAGWKQYAAGYIAGEMVLQKRAAERDTTKPLLTKLNDQVAVINGRLVGLERAARRSELRTWSFWLAVVSGLIALAALFRDYWGWGASRPGSPPARNKIPQSAAAGELFGAGGRMTQRKVLSVTTNDVLCVRTPSGTAALIQFTSFDGYAASYQWRRRSPAGALEKGSGQVRESYDSEAKQNGKLHLTARPDHDPFLKAGDITLEWSYGSTTNGWIYLDDSRAQVDVLPPEAFEKEL